jgi:hypothetical protein
VPTRFEARLPDGRRYFGNCVWDALGIPSMLALDATIEARCGCCEDRMRLEVAAGGLTHSEGVVHFGVPVREWWTDIAFT